MIFFVSCLVDSEHNIIKYEKIYFIFIIVKLIYFKKILDIISFALVYIEC
jgi:hypothetical protein